MSKEWGKAEQAFRKQYGSVSAKFRALRDRLAMFGLDKPQIDWRHQLAWPGAGEFAFYFAYCQMPESPSTRAIGITFFGPDDCAAAVYCGAHDGSNMHCEMLERWGPGRVADIDQGMIEFVAQGTQVKSDSPNSLAEGVASW